MDQQTPHNFNSNQGNHEPQFQNGATHHRMHNFCPNSYEMQSGFTGGVQQQHIPNYLPAPQMDQCQAPMYQNQSQQYDNQGLYPPYMNPQNHHPYSQVTGPQYNNEQQWRDPYGHYPPYHSQIASKKTEKMTNRYHLLGFCGRSAYEDVTEIFQILDSNEDWMTKCNELENRLNVEQRGTPLIEFMLWKDLVKEFAAHAFRNKKMSEEFMMKGFTPFCLQQLDSDSEMSLILHEERMAQMTTTSYSDLEKKSKKLKITPISDVLGFITAIANTHALAKVLFSTTSPLTIGLHELQKIVLLGKQEGHLQIISSFQPNWFAYAMWAMYGCCHDFFKMHLSHQDLLEGAHLKNPFKDLNYEISRWQEITMGGIPACLGYLNKIVDASPELENTRKR